MDRVLACDVERNTPSTPLQYRLNILNMVGRRVTWNMCRNWEWQAHAVSCRLHPWQRRAHRGSHTQLCSDGPRPMQVCALAGRLPGQQGTGRKIFFADAPAQLEVAPWESAPWRHSASTPETETRNTGGGRRGCSGPAQMSATNRTKGYNLREA